ncbi:MAG: hypothetical protein FRX49_02282 [Trebouxia sp. A1-2]|nr:MAG: hypothetical protein FRX49_02282 [Trebouxia sp. A1-2]
MEPFLTATRSPILTNVSRDFRLQAVSFQMARLFCVSTLAKGELMAMGLTVYNLPASIKLRGQSHLDGGRAVHVPPFPLCQVQQGLVSSGTNHEAAHRRLGRGRGRRSGGFKVVKGPLVVGSEKVRGKRAWLKDRWGLGWGVGSTDKLCASQKKLNM